MTAMTGEEKAGLLLLSLDARVAEAVLGKLKPEAKTRLTSLMQRLKASPQRGSFAAEVLEEVENALQKPALRVVGNLDATVGPSTNSGAPLTTRAPANPPSTGGKTGNPLTRVNEPTKAAPLKLARISDSPAEPQDDVDPLAALNSIATDRLLLALAAESPRTIALILNQLTGENGGDIFKQLSPDVRREVSVHMATCVMPGTEVVRRTVRAILAKEQSLPEVIPDQKGDARFKKMAQLLWKLERTERSEALAALQDRDPGAASQVRELLYLFTDLLRLDSRSMQKVLGQSDGKILAVALKGAEEDVKQVVMENMSKRARDGLLEEMEFLGTIPANQIQQAQKSIVDIIQQLDQAGELVMVR